jgi:hypothetical protein
MRSKSSRGYRGNYHMKLLSRTIVPQIALCCTLQALDIINQTNSPKFVEIVEHRPVGEHATFGVTIFRGELQPGETRSCTPSCNKLIVDIRWDQSQVIIDEKYMLREDNPDKINQWTCIARHLEQALAHFGPVPIMLPPNTPIHREPDGKLSIELRPGHTISVNPDNYHEARVTLLREIPFRLLKNKIVERIAEPLVLFNRRVIHMVSWRPTGQAETEAVNPGPKHIIIKNDDGNSVTIYVS